MLKSWTLLAAVATITFGGTVLAMAVHSIPRYTPTDSTRPPSCIRSTRFSVRDQLRGNSI